MMKSANIFFVLALALLSLGFQERTDHLTAWNDKYPGILKQIKEPAFKKKTWDISKYGAVAGKPEFLNTSIINSTIDLCSRKGGGTVFIPAGTWHTGPIVLKSKVNLHVAEGATLLFSSDTSLYPRVLTRWEGMDCYNVSPMIYAYGQKNIAITGKGTIDGGASRQNWWGMPRLNAVAGKPLRGRALLMDYAEKSVPVEQRIMWACDNLRPQLINFYKCSGIVIRGVTLTRPAFWTIHPLLSENIIVDGVTIVTAGAPNGDGCDPESCKNVLIENCFFNTGDDCIAIKSGRNNDGRKWNVPSENIIVRNCRMENGHGGVVIGSEISGGYRNLFVENCEMSSPQLDRVIRIKTNNCRGGTIENVYVRNVNVGQCSESVLHINMVYEPNESCRRDFPPFVKNIYLDNVTCRQSRYGVFIAGFEESVNVQDINLLNCDWTNVKQNNMIEGKVERLKFENTRINSEPVKN